jgi:hypothetical protein
MIPRTELTEQFVNYLMECYDLNDLIQIVYEHLAEGYDAMTEAELMGEVREFAPHLLGPSE